MPRKISIAEKIEAIRLIKEGKQSQREIASNTGLSRPYLRKLSMELGHQFPRNGLEIRGEICMCMNCGMFLRRPNSKIERATTHFCSTTCKALYTRGDKHHSWKGGGSSSTFSNWIKNQSTYHDWRRAVLERDNYTCQITGISASDQELDVHHIMPKAEYQHLALDVNNGVTVCQEAHDRIHVLIREGKGYDEAVNLTKAEFANKKLNKKI